MRSARARARRRAAFAADAQITGSPDRARRTGTTGAAENRRLRVGIVDVGANTVRLLVATQDGAARRRARGARQLGLGEEIERNGRISEKKLAQTRPRQRPRACGAPASSAAPRRGARDLAGPPGGERRRLVAGSRERQGRTDTRARPRRRKASSPGAAPSPSRRVAARPSPFATSAAAQPRSPSARRRRPAVGAVGRPRLAPADPPRISRPTRDRAGRARAEVIAERSTTSRRRCRWCARRRRDRACAPHRGASSVQDALRSPWRVSSGLRARSRRLQLDRRAHDDHCRRAHPQRDPAPADAPLEVGRGGLREGAALAARRRAAAATAT